MRNNIFFISTHDIGGISTFLNHCIEYLISKKKYNIFFFDKNPSKILKNKNKINFFKTSVIENVCQTKKIININLKKNEIKKTIIFITNYIILPKYFFFLIKFRINGGRIFLSLHSGILTYTIKRYLGCLVSSFFFYIVDNLYYNSKYTKLWWLRLFPWLGLKKSEIVPLGIKINKVKRSKIKSILTITFLGRIEHEKNPQLFLELAAYCHRLGLKYKFQIYGHGSLFRNLKKKYIHFVKFKKWTNNDSIYKNTHVVIITSKIETFSYVAIEAKNYGIPIITCSNGGIKEVVQNDGIICKNNKFALKAALKKVHDNYNFFSKNAIKNKINYNLNKSMSRYWADEKKQ